MTDMFPDIMDYTRTFGEQLCTVTIDEKEIDLSITTFQFKTYRLAMVRIKPRVEKSYDKQKTTESGMTGVFKKFLGVKKMES